MTVLLASADGSRSALYGPLGINSPYRYLLTRRFQLDLFGTTKTCTFVMLNPSTATHEGDDPTIRRCIGYANAWGYSQLVVANLFAIRSTDPKLVYEHTDPIGPQNDELILDAATKAQLVVCAWGSGGASTKVAKDTFRTRSQNVRELLQDFSPHLLRLNEDGEPGHPLYLPMDLEPSRW